MVPRLGYIPRLVPFSSLVKGPVRRSLIELSASATTTISMIGTKLFVLVDIGHNLADEMSYFPLFKFLCLTCEHSWSRRDVTA